MSNDDLSNTNTKHVGTVGDVTIAGHKIAWTSLSVTISIERFPRTFEIETTDSSVQYSPICGDEVVMNLASDYVIEGQSVIPVVFFTGWVDSIQRRLDAHGHTVIIRGRSKCSDLVDCSAEFVGALVNKSLGDGVPGAYIMNVTTRQLAESLCQPYQIGVVSLSDRTENVLLQVDVNIGETPYAIIERAARSQNLIVIDNNVGELAFLEVGGGGKCASGLELGKNIESITMNLDNSQRYSIYTVLTQAVYTQLQTIPETMGSPGLAFDAGITRHRRLMGFCETPNVSVSLHDWIQQRAVWECNRRYGRSQAVQIVTDQWVDVDGDLFYPNKYIDVKATRFGFDTAKSDAKKWIIAEVTYSRSVQSGTSCAITIMPEQAFSIEPTVLSRMDPAIGIAINAISSGTVPDASTPSAGGLT